MWGKFDPPSWLFRPPSQPVDPTRRSRLTIIATATTILAFITFAVIATPRGWSSAKSLDPVPGIRPYTGWPDPEPWNPPHPKDSGSGWSPAEQLIVKVRLQNEDVDWLEKIKWMWRSEIITVNHMYTNAHPQAHRPDKGRVADAYLKWIIENYHHLPETLIMLPPEDRLEIEEEEQGVHEFDVKNALRHFQSAFVQATGFANLQCPTHKSSTTCNNHVLISKTPSYEFRILEAKIPEVWKALFPDQPETPVVFASVLGSKFAVSKEQVLKRSLDDYLRFWTWLNKTIMDDDSSGLVLEYLWHVIFGKEPVFCPDRAGCECDAYGKC